MSLRWKLKELAHRRGWLASPILAFQGVPFGPGKRDIGGEIIRDLGRRCEDGTCSLCNPDAARWAP